jgi:hypothetical protein
VKHDELTAALATGMSSVLAADLVRDFLSIRQDVSSGTLGSAAPGKFVETVVQVLQHLDTGTYAQKPNVDDYLKNLESKATKFDDGLKICATRIARSVYTLRNKRNIAHKGDVDSNKYDLQFIHASAQWLMAELLRQIVGGTMQNAGSLIERVQAPAGWLVEDLAGTKIVLGKVTILMEILLLLHSSYPEPQIRSAINSSLARRDPSSVRKALTQLWKTKRIEVVGDKITLTKNGLAEAVKYIHAATAA